MRAILPSANLQTCPLRCATLAPLYALDAHVALAR